MHCVQCSSSNLVECIAEIQVHSRGLRNIDRPGIWVFPALFVCLDCGSARFSIPQAELSQLAQVAEIPSHHAGTGFDMAQSPARLKTRP
jgi:hypothetical protein